MTEKQVTAVVGIFYSIAAVMVLTGTFLELQHNPNGSSILLYGFMLGTVISWYDTYRLKKKIKSLNEQLNQKKD
jgi:uncharacterized membrane protein